MIERKVQPFDSFSVVYKVLIRVGFFQLLNNPKNRFKRVCYQMYRILVFLLVVVYNLHHIIFIIQRRNNMDDVFEALMLEIPHFNLLVKYVTLNLRIPRINKMNKLLNEPIFAADSKIDENLLLKNEISMHRLTKAIYIGITIAALFWPTSYFARRYQDETTVMPSYIPFNTDTWGKFSLAVLLEILPFVWIAYGHLSVDCVVVTCYAQAEVQFKIIKYNIEHLFNRNDALTTKSDFLYRDMIDKDLKRRFVYYVQRYEKLTWYAKEIDKVFNPALSFQFFSSTISLCSVAWKMSSTPAGTVPFMFLIILILIIAIQIFLYCYFGNLVNYESQSMVNSLYLSDWLSVSPQFRRLILIAMLRWSRALRPTISCIVPLSLTTFVTFFRSAYSLYAVLSTKRP